MYALRHTPTPTAPNPHPNNPPPCFQLTPLQEEQLHDVLQLQDDLLRMKVASPVRPERALQAMHESASRPPQGPGRDSRSTDTAKENNKPAGVKSANQSASTAQPAAVRPFASFTIDTAQLQADGVACSSSTRGLMAPFTAEERAAFNEWQNALASSTLSECRECLCC